MTSEELNAMQDELARTIRQQAEAALEQALQLMSEGVAPRDALAQVTQTFTGQYYEALSDAFTMVLGDYVGIADIKALNISGIDLSDALYTHIQRTNLTAQQVINDHMKGFVQARKLAMDLYEGYGFKDDPLKVKAKLPKYLRQALKDPAIDDGYRRLLAQIRTNQIKTPALKAGYQQLLDELENGVGRARLKNLLKTAWFERNRYFANRIAQTETSRAYMNGVAQELMADDQVVWVQYEMSRTHPRVDICDRHARLNAYGQGPGIYPKAQAPKPPAHPFCRCKITPRYDVEEEPGKPIKNAERSFMAGLDSRDQRLIAGSRAKLEAFNEGKTLESIYNGSAKPMYRWGRLGDGVSDEIEYMTGDRDPITKRYFNNRIFVNDPGGFMRRNGMQVADVARLSGAMDGSTVNIDASKLNAIEASFIVNNKILDDGKPMERSVRIIGSNIVVLNHGFMLKTEHQGLGIGTRSLAIEAQAAKELGAVRIDTYAEGSASDMRYVGYKVWPKFGYDASLSQREIQSLPNSLSSARTVLDLVETEEGAKWWEEHGTGRFMSLDLRENSRSMRIMREYLQSAGVRL